MSKRRRKRKSPSPEVSRRLGVSKWLALGAALAVVGGAAAWIAARRTPATHPSPRKAALSSPLPDAPSPAPPLPSASAPPSAPASPATAAPSVPAKTAQAQSRFREAVALAKAGRYEESIRVFEEVARLEPFSPETFANIGKAYLELGRPDEAIRYYRGALQLQPRSAGYHDMLGVAYGMKGDYETALQEFEQAMLLNPSLASAYNNAGMAYEKQENVSRAMEMYRKAIELDPTLTRAYGNLARLYIQMGLYGEVRPLMERLRKANPGDPMAAKVLAQLESLLQPAGKTAPSPEGSSAGPAASKGGIRLR